eukprot:c10009_g1_i1.p2 GENE.c10009_g1_i1~~c10009_g1_i1.p2  ORF type:complete len:115 (-),score=19.75 c10009_g1_i1:39-383(-)
MRSRPFPPCSAALALSLLLLLDTAAAQTVTAPPPPTSSPASLEDTKSFIGAWVGIFVTFWGVFGVVAFFVWRGCLRGGANAPVRRDDIESLEELQKQLLSIMVSSLESSSSNAS